MPQRYQILRRLQPFLRILPWVAGSFYVLTAIFGLWETLTIEWAPGQQPSVHSGVWGVLAFFSRLLAAVGWWLVLTVGAEFISVVIDTEENTRLTAELLQEPEEEPEAPT